MARDGSGTYSRPVAPYTYDTVISETSVNSEMDQIATALTDSIAKDGQTTPTANLPMGGYKHTNVAAATDQTHYARVDQVQKGTLTYLTSVGGTADAITATAALGATALTAGMRFSFVPGSDNATTTPTININAIGDKTIKRDAGAALLAGDIVNSRPAEVLYDGTDMILLNPYNVLGEQAGDIALADLADAGAAAAEALGADIIDDGSGNLAQTTLIDGKSDTDFNVTESMWGKMVVSTNKTANRTATLPLLSGTTEGFQVIIANASSDSYDLTIARSGSDAIYGPPGSTSSAIILRPNARVKLVKRSSAWRVVSNDPSLATTYTPGIVELATDAEAVAKSASDKALVPSNLAALRSESASGTQYSTISGTLTFAHGLGSQPVRWGGYLVVTADTNGWTTGQILDANTVYDSITGAPLAMTIQADATNVKAACSSGLFCRNGSTGANAALDNTKVELKLWASLI